VDSIIEEANQHRINANIEENIRQHKLKEAERARKELEDKLGMIRDNINTLGSDQPLENEEKKAKAEHVKLLDENTRKQYYEE
jgi:5'-3' exonuclease